MAPLRSWVPIPRGCHFSLANIPFGIISTPPSSTTLRPAIAIGEHALDLSAFAAGDGFAHLSALSPDQLAVFSEPSLNAFAALGKPFHCAVRKYIQIVLAEDTPHPEVLKTNEALRKQALVPLADVRTHLPLRVGDYTDFYAGRNHAYNIGVLFRGPANALQPNYTHLPVGYHGRASSVVVSGTPIRRPRGQILENPTADPKVPTFSACRKLDLELELGAFVCRANAMGEPVRLAGGEAEESIFGLVLMNDWSARDIQAWEYVPLGPFNSKNFGTSISPWVVLLDALEPFRTAGLENETELLPYLREDRKDNAYDIKLEVDIISSKTHRPTTITRTTARNLLFSFPQMLAHHTVGGCPFNVGDLLGSGTISGTEPGTQGSLLEQNANGKARVKLEEGEERAFLEDGDEVVLRGWCGGEDETGLVGFGECRGRIEPAVGLDY